MGNIKFMYSQGAVQRDMLFQQADGQVFNGVVEAYDNTRQTGYIRCEALSREKDGLNLKFVKKECRAPVELLVSGTPCYFTLRITDTLHARPEARDVHLMLPNQPMPPLPSASTSSSSVADKRGAQASAESFVGWDAKRR